MWLPEGSILRLKDGSIWIVKGCYHPRNGYVAIPRVVDGKKLKTYREALKVILRYYLHYLKSVPEIGRGVPVVPLKDVVEVLNPFNVSSLPESLLERKAMKLIQLLETRCGLRCGLSGSLLGGYASKDSDIDVVCLDREDAFKCLSELRMEGVLRAFKEGEFIEESRAVVENISLPYLTRLAIGRVTQGMFEGKRYTLKIINCGREKLYRGPYLAVRSDEVILIVKEFDYRSPSIYPVEIMKPTTLYRETVLLTHRVRFAELGKGTLIWGRALLHVNDKALIISFDAPGCEVKALRKLLP